MYVQLLNTLPTVFTAAKLFTVTVCQGVAPADVRIWGDWQEVAPLPPCLLFSLPRSPQCLGGRNVSLMAQL